jgi:stage V sporulation protein R
MANHAARVRQHIDRYGVEAVEDFIDACLSLENLIDYHSHFIERQDKKERTVAGAEDEEETVEVPRLKSKRYMETYINPPAFMEEQKAKIAEKRKRKRMLPEEPRRDVLQFLLEHAPLENWERDILAMVRDEAYYFAPQAMTKVANEGWACLARNSLTFTDLGLMSIGDVVEGEAKKVSDGTTPRSVYDAHVIRDHATVRLKTRRGLFLSSTCTVLMADGHVASAGQACPRQARREGRRGLWRHTRCAYPGRPLPRISLEDVATHAGVSYWTSEICLRSQCREHRRLMTRAAVPGCGQSALPARASRPAQNTEAGDGRARGVSWVPHWRRTRQPREAESRSHNWR